MAAALQIMPLVRTAVQALQQSLAPSGWAIVFRWAAGGMAMFGYHAVSKASSIAISPPNATVGQPYVGTVTYSGGHAGSVSSMSLTNICLGSPTPLFDNLSIIYSGANTATVTGTPTNAGTFAFNLKIFDGSTCGGGNSDTRTTSLVVGTSGGGGVGPVITSPPQGVTAQVGADALMSAGASGNPTPGYYWYRGLPNIPANLVGTNSSLHFPSVQLTDAGLYTVVASNASGQASSPAYLSVVVTPGTNQLALNYTNYFQQGQALTMYSYLTNVPNGSNTYKWQYNSVDITQYSTNGNTFSLTPAQVIPSKSGKYSIVFNSVVGTSAVVDQQLYYSYWAFGLPPVINRDPQGTNVSSGASVLLSAAATNVSVPAISPALPYYGTNTLLTFQWLFNGTNVLATQVTNGLAAMDSLTLNSVGAANEGDYSVVVSNYWGSATSSVAHVSVGSSGATPVITAQPAGRSVLIGQNTSFSVAATGSGPLSYQWKHENTNVFNGGVYSGVNTNVLVLTGAGIENAGAYSVTITNTAGSTNSISAPLTVQPPPAVTLTRNGSSLQLNATTVTGITYVVLTTTNLSSPWTPVETNSVSGAGSLSFTNTAANPQQFFRLAFP